MQYTKSLMNKKIFEISHQLLVYCFFAVLGVTPLIFSPGNSELFELPKIVLLYALTLIIAFLWVVKMTAQSKVLFTKTPADFFLLLFLLSQVVSTFLSVDQQTSLFGYYSRFNGGLLSVISYSVLYWAAVSNLRREDATLLVRLLVGSAITIGIYGVLEHFGASPSCLFMQGELNVDCWSQDVQSRVFATIGQPNWMAAWLTAIAPLAWYKLIKANDTRIGANIRRSLSPKFVLVSLLIFSAILFTKSRSGLLGFGIAFTMFWPWILFVKSSTNTKYEIKNIKPFLILTSLFIILAGIFGTPWTPSVSQLAQNLFPKNANTPAPSESNILTSPVIARTNPNILSPQGTDSGDIRKIVWEGALSIWKAYPLFGSGVETFAYTYYNYRPKEHNLTSEWDLLYSKAHNEYLNFLSTTGGVGLTTYLLLIAAFLWQFIKNIKFSSTNHLTFLAGFSSLLITNFFGFSVIPTQTLFFLFPALSFVVAQESPSTNEKYQIKNSKSLLLLLPLLLLICYLLFRISGLYFADRYWVQAKKENKSNNPIQAIEKAQKALDLNPWEPRFYEEMAESTSLLAETYAKDENTREKAQEYARLTEDLSNKTLQISPGNLLFWSSKALAFEKMKDVSPEYLNKAIEARIETTRLAPTDPETYTQLGRLYIASEKYQEAEATLKKAIELKANYSDPHLSLADLYIRTNRKEEAIKELTYIFEKIDSRDEEIRKLIEDVRNSGGQETY